MSGVEMMRSVFVFLARQEVSHCRRRTESVRGEGDTAICGSRSTLTGSAVSQHYPSIREETYPGHLKVEIEPPRGRLTPLKSREIKSASSESVIVLSCIA